MPSPAVRSGRFRNSRLEVRKLDQAYDPVALGLQRFTTALFSIDQREDAINPGARGFNPEQRPSPSARRIFMLNLL